MGDRRRMKIRVRRIVSVEWLRLKKVAHGTCLCGTYCPHVSRVSAPYTAPDMPLESQQTHALYGRIIFEIKS